MTTQSTQFQRDGVPACPVSTHLGRSIFAFLLFWPLGIVALIYSIKASAGKRCGDLQQAQAYAHRAAAWGMAALGVFFFGGIGLLVGNAVWNAWK